MSRSSRLAPRMGTVGASPTAAISDTVRALAADGITVDNLGEGELDFDTPAPIAEAGINAIRAGLTKYTAVAGTTGLKDAIRAHFRRQNGLDYAASEVIAACGAKQIIFNAFLATLDAGDEVIVPTPCWVSYPDMIRLAGGVPVLVPCLPENGWKLSAHDLARAITPRTRWIILNSPNNPTGAVYSAAELGALCDVLAAHDDILIMADDIYEAIVYDAAFATPAALRPDLASRILTINGVSKSFSMTGWRLGYAGGPAWLIAALDTLQSQSTSNPSSISQDAARVALEGGTDFLDTWMPILRKRRDMVMAMIRQTPGLDATLPEGAFYVFADIRGCLNRTTPSGRVLHTDVDFATYLLEAARVAVVPGSAFRTPGYVRIAYGVSTQVLSACCARMQAACTALR
ncbi:pyridoxal phosphate-dependent aminotransferase [Komagataeibacter sp. FNDCF1]|uniref:pyridoxal phosphate-dependent aminotransferase n=1 Tax=Komagataeibacter sp. FNDCF1 TaxID=2878681 RepID=UPI001E4D2D6A|nr:pyridoxal phosphate-dependent aminotransferase [Komagataeibacter sp. FNDCF1]MCE2563243.1 pyridoxal phosphate-dependent aminotransferase [Komagataeibacter sp. FNDCF1]